MSFILYNYFLIQHRSCKKVLCLLLVVSCYAQFSYSQDLTPEAASLGKYGTIAMTEYTGTPNIRIPLLEVKSGDVSYPIELYYDASGIKVEQNATFVGLGWNLSCGGYIKHIVCGHDDFQQTPNSPQSYFESNFQVYSAYSPFILQMFSKVIFVETQYRSILTGKGMWQSHWMRTPASIKLLFLIFKIIILLI